jgi:hypothetical protein
MKNPIEEWGHQETRRLTSRHDDMRLVKFFKKRLEKGGETVVVDGVGLGRRS